MEPLDASDVSKLLIEIGQRLELGGESIFKVRAYYNAAESLLSLTTPLAEIVAKGKLREIPGVGEAIAEKIVKLHKTGTHPTLEYLREQFPSGVLEMLSVPKLGPKKVMLIYNELKIASLEELEKACLEGKLEACKGLGAALQKKILQGLEFRKKGVGLRLMHHAAEILESAKENLAKSHPELKRVAVSGPYRRGCEVIDELSLVAEMPDGDGSAQTLSFAKELKIFVADQKRYGVTQLFATGSADHIKLLQKLATKRGLKLDVNGLSRGGKEVPCKDEAEIYTELGIPFIEPELREGGEEVALADAGKLPVLVSDKDIRGVLHSHTDFSDGTQPLKEMAEATRKRGYQYYGVADHSQSAAYAGGLKEDKILEQHRIADELNAGFGEKFRIFKGIESDIRDDGSLDYPETLLKKFEFIVASVHSRFTLDKDSQTKRIIRAVSNPHTTILGHMTGRLLLRREGYSVDIEAILKACAEHGVVVEINADPHRLDLDWRWHQRGLELGCMFSINPDAHSIADIDLTHWGVEMARKGGVPKERVLNCMTLAEFTRFLKQRRDAKKAR